MKKIYVFLLGMILTASLFAQNTWTQKTNFSGSARYRGKGLAIGSKGYVLMGACNGVPSTTDFWEYNPALDSWTQKCSFPGTARGGGYMAAFEINGKGYFGLGANWNGTSSGYTCYNDFWEYDPGTDTWTQKASFPGLSRHCVASFSISGTGYVACGKNEATQTFLNDLWAYNPSTDTWTQKASLGTVGRANCAGFAIGKFGYVGCGLMATGSEVKDFWKYDPMNDTWTQIINYPGAASVLTSSFSMGEFGYVGFGYNGTTRFKDFWRYDPIMNTWTAQSDLTGIARYSAACFAVNNKAYVTTGYGTFYLNDLWEYTPDITVGTNYFIESHLSYIWSSSQQTLTINAPAISSVTIFDIKGNLLSNFNYSNLSEVSLPLSNLADGIYIFSVITDGIKISKKICKND